MSNDVMFNLVSFNNEAEQGVDARELHEKLEVGRDFSTWIKGKLESMEFIEGEDFIRSPVLGSAHRVDYVLSIEVSKHIAMAEHNEVGKRVRQYFIDVEKRAREVHAKGVDMARLLEQQNNFMFGMVNKMCSAMENVCNSNTTQKRTKKKEEEFVPYEIEPGYLSVPKGCSISRQMTSTAEALWKHKIVELLRHSEGGSVYVNEIIEKTPELFGYERDYLLCCLTEEGVIEPQANSSKREYWKYILRRCFNGY